MTTAKIQKKVSIVILFAFMVQFIFFLIPPTTLHAASVEEMKVWFDANGSVSSIVTYGQYTNCNVRILEGSYFITINQANSSYAIYHVKPNTHSQREGMIGIYNGSTLIRTYKIIQTGAFISAVSDIAFQHGGGEYQLSFSTKPSTLIANAKSSTPLWLSARESGTSNNLWFIYAQNNSTSTAERKGEIAISTGTYAKKTINVVQKHKHTYEIGRASCRERV